MRSEEAATISRTTRRSSAAAAAAQGLAALGWRSSAHCVRRVAGGWNDLGQWRQWYCPRRRRRLRRRYQHQRPVDGGRRRDHSQWGQCAGFCRLQRRRRRWWPHSRDLRPNSTFTGIITAYGGFGGTNWGGAGTIYSQITGQPTQVILDNGGHVGPSTLLQSANFANLTLQNGARGYDTFTTSFANLLVTSNSWLTASSHILGNFTPSAAMRPFSREVVF